MKILQENLVHYKDDKTKVILVVDAYNVIFSQGPDFVLNKFESFKPARIVFGAEDICWPDENLQVTINNFIEIFFRITCFCFSV